MAASADGPRLSTIPAYRDAVVDLLGVLAYGEITAFERLAEDAKLAPDLADKVALAAMASARVRPLRAAARPARRARRGPVRGDGAVPARRSTRSTATPRPSDWLEGLVKAYVGDGLAADFYREVAAFLDPDTRELVLDPLSDTGHAAFVVDAGARGDRRRPAGRRPARAVGTPAHGRGAEPGADGRRPSATR